MADQTTYDGEFTAVTPFQSDTRDTKHWLMSHVRRQGLLVVVMFVGAFGNAFLAAMLSVLIGMAFNSAVADPPNLSGIAWAAGMIIVTALIRAVLMFGRNFATAIIGERLERDMRQELYASLLSKSMTFHDLQPVGETMARATNDVREVNLMISLGVNLVVGSATFMVMPLLLTPRYSWQLLLAPVFFVVTYILSLIRYMSVLQGVSDRVRAAFGRINSRLAEVLDGIETVKAMAREDEESRLFDRNATEYREAAVAQGRVEARFLPLLLLGITEAVGFTQAIILLRQGQLQVGDVVAYMGLLSLFNFPTFISILAYSRVSLGFASARRVLELIQAETDLQQNPEGRKEAIRGEIRFEEISFGYRAGLDVLEDISFTVRPGQTVAIVGQTGSGKSTLVKLVNRTYDVDRGRVLIDGVDVREWDLAALRQQISIIEQDIFLFSRSIADNIAFGRPTATREEIEGAARAAQAHDFIMGFKEGYDTLVGGRGVTLSGGQRQRLALARAFLTDPHILILDDSTSAVDSATEDQIQRAIRTAAQDRTTLLITHRLSQIRWADLVLVLRKGRLEAAGDHATLMQTSPAYRRIFEQYETLDADRERD